MTSICDTSGNLLFYTNGIWVNNAQHQLMQNGDSLNPGQITEDFRPVGHPICNSAIILPHPVQNNKYYIFHQSLSYTSDVAGFGEHLYYSLVDMNANGGLGQVEQKNEILVSDSICKGQLHAVKHANGRDWWLLQAKSWSTGFYTFLVTENTIALEHEQYVGDTSRLGNGAEWTGQCVFSPQGDKYARYDDENDLDIYDFDRCTGLLSNNIHIPIQDSMDNRGGISCGVAISPSGQYLYVSSLIDLYQFDLWATNITNSQNTVAVTDSFYQLFPGNSAYFSFLQLAPDNKIYGVVPNLSYMHVIDNPDLGGSSCNVQQHGINTNFLNGFFMPNHPHYRTPALTGSPCDTLTSSIAIEQAEQQGIRLYPNPASTSISIEAAQGIERVVVYNALGQQVLSVPGREQLLLELETRSLENGSYFVSVWLADKVVTKQFQVLR